MLKITKEEIKEMKTEEIKKRFVDLCHMPLRDGPIKDIILTKCYIELCRREGKDPKPNLEDTGMIDLEWVKDWLLEE